MAIIEYTYIHTYVDQELAIIPVAVQLKEI